MSGELARRSGYTLVGRQHSRDLAAIEREMEKADARLTAIGAVTRQALLGALVIENTRAQAAQMAPSGTPAYNLVASQGAIEMAAVIADLARATR